MSTKINVSYKSDNYVLEFSRTTAQQLEEQGFVLDQVGDKPAKMIPMLVYYAFQKNHRGIKRKEVEEIYDNLLNKVGKENEDGFVHVLCEMYAESVSTLMDDSAIDEGNAAIWKVTKG
jgi:hypothetical protein